MSPAARPSSSAAPDGARWWHGAVGYQVYLRSFADGSGDGVGDLRGLREHLDHLARLGADAVWITPFYASPQVDFGYDVSDHRAVHPDYGTLHDFDAMLAEAHRLGLRVVIDLVPNHTSDQHAWFRGALTGRDAPTRDHYVWSDPGPDGGPPNNWVSKFGGPAWTLHAPTGQYYLHSFLPEQPDLNWQNPHVRDEFDDLLRFWLDRGVDGFRVDAAHYLLKDRALRDNPQPRPPGDVSDPEAVFDSYDHHHDLDQRDVVEIYRRWRRLVADHDAVLIGEVVLPDPVQVHRYTVGALHLAFHFPTLQVPWDADAIRGALVEPLALAPGGAFAWPVSSHDDPRVAQRFGGGATGARRALAYLTLLTGLPGMTFLLQGDELGLDHGTIDPSGARDPLAVRNPGVAGRDGSRTPMPWAPGHQFGFTSGTPWIPFPTDRSDRDTVAVQATDPRSPLAGTRRLLGTRRGLSDLTGSDPVVWLTGSGPLVAYRRGRTVVALNAGAQPAELVPPAPVAELAFCTDRTTADGDHLVLAPDSALVVTVTDTPAAGTSGGDTSVLRG